MNPASREAKRTLIKTLNDATLDPNTGEKDSCYPHRHLLDLTTQIAEVVIAPPALYLIPILELLRKDVKVAAQNCHSKTAGAFTGEIRYGLPPISRSSLSRPPLTTIHSISPTQLVDAGVPYVIIGMSRPPQIVSDLWIV